MGFRGVMIVLALYLIIIFEIIRLASKAKDLTGRLICVGMAALIAFQSFVNIMVATKMMPNTGQPLPLSVRELVRFSVFISESVLC